MFAQCCALLRQGDPAALTMLPRLEQFAGFAPGWEQLGAALDHADQPRAARVAYLRAASGYQAAAAATGDRRPALAHAQCLRRAGHADQASSAFAALAQREPDDADAWFGLGLARQDTGDRAGAVSGFATALARRPGWHEAALNLGVARQEAGDLDGALDAYAAALAARPQALARIAQALSTQARGRLFLDLDELRRALLARA